MPAHASASEPEGPAVNGRVAVSRTIVLSLRLCAQDSSGYPSDVSWGSDAPAAALAVDVISASGGAPDPPHDAVLPARFSSLQSALLAARRLQWGLQGLAESGFQGVAASMIIHSDAGTGSAGPSLERLSPGQVVIECSLAEAVQALPGAILRETSDGHWRELLLQGAESISDFSSDERSMLGLIRAMGREDPCPTTVEVPRRPTATTAAPVTGAFEPSGALGRSILEPEPGSAIGKFKWLIVGGAAAIMVLVAVLVIPRMVSGSHDKTPAQSPSASTQTAVPPPPTPAPAPAAVTEKPQNPKLPAKTGKPRGDAKSEPAMQKPAITGSCDLTEAEIPRSLNRAEQYMYAGRLEEAQAMYQRVLPCPSAHEKAVEGLQHVKQRMAAQSP